MEQHLAISLTLPPMMTIETAEVLAAELRQLPLTEKIRLTLDASRVEIVTTPGLQLLVSLERTLAAKDGALEIRGGRDQFAGAFAVAGLEGLLKQP